MTDDSRNQGCCLTCLHYDRMYRACRYDLRDQDKHPDAPKRLDAVADVRTFRCPDYLGWENELLPFTPPGGKTSR